MNRKILFLIIGILLIGIIPFISSVGEISYCCEKTAKGAWCMNAPEQECNPNFRKVPTSCEATSYCKPGCCYDSQEGTCMENTPEIVCNNNGGVYSKESASCDIPQCSLGCCFVGEQAAFVTQTRCKRLSALYGLETNFRTDIGNEVECIASTTSDVKGACVFEKEFETTCKLLTQKECKKMEQSSTESNIEFHPEYLCSSEELGTNCGPTTKTTCVEGKDEVYFLDSCGNLANIYDAEKINNKEYWSKIKGKEESCGYSSANGNADSSKCGNCDYYFGSTCKQYERNQDIKPNYGDNICRNLDCTYEGKNYKHGETWCATNSESEDSPGSEYFRLVCYNNEVTIEPCAAFRQEICIQSEVNGFKTAACSANLWRDCVTQDNQKDCENTDKRDCQWIFNGNYFSNGTKIFVCTPLYAPGFDFWKEESEAGEICKMASTECIAKFQKRIFEGKWNCVENCECCVNDDKHEGCTGDKWQNYKEAICQSLGDCGIKKNYIGIQGYNKDGEDLEVY